MPDGVMDLLAARGAICLSADKAALVDKATARLMSALAEANGIDPSDCIFLLFR